MNDTNNKPTTSANDIVRALETRGESKDYIIGFLVGTIDGLRHNVNTQVDVYIENTLAQVKRKG